jgi:hypothetical protein
MPTIKNRRRSVKLALLAILTGLGAAVILSEIALTVLSAFFYPRLTVSDPVLGWKYRPTDEPVTRRFSKDVVYSIAINDEGFRDDEFITANGVRKIMVLGDSQTLGMEVDQTETFAAVLEERLEQDLRPQPIDVMNFGITGYGTAQQLLCLKRYGHKYRPEVVLLMIFELNDFTDNASTFDGGRFRPHFLLDEGRLILADRPSTSERVFTFLRDHSTLFFIVSNQLAPGFLRGSLPLDEQGRIDLMKAILAELFQTVRSAGQELYVFYIREPASPPRRFHEVSSLVTQNGIPFREIPFLAEERVEGSGHWNAQGHRRAAEIIRDELRRRSSLYGKADAR